MADVLGLQTWINDNGERRWGCRGIGPKYEAFYQWLHKVPLVEITHQSEDWPWHYFGFHDPKRDAEVRELWPDDIDDQGNALVRRASS